MDGHDKLHIVMFPWLAFGHLIPYLELAKLIAQKGHKISFISTPRNIARLSKIPPNLASSINLVKLTLLHEDDLPNNAEATTDIPFHKIPYLKKAFDGLQDGLAQFLETSSPDWIIYDFAAHWLPSIAGKLGISRAFFYIYNSWSICFFGPSSLALINGDDPRTELEHFTVPPKWVPFPSNVAFRQHEIKRAFESCLQVNSSGISDTCRFGWSMSGCDVFVPRSCTELESDWLKLLGELHQRPVLPSGLLPPPVQGNIEDPDNTWLHIREWLNKQDQGSVVYVALGSEVTLSQNELIELALGLELSGLPFFWALRRVNDSVELPDGFDERVKGRGIVWTSWAPQLSILGHESVGGFLTHCGWSSIIEGLNFGRALVMLPFWGDQGLNARVFEEKKIGKEIPKDDIDGSFTRNSVAETLRLVIVDKEGEIYRDKAKEMIKLFGDKNLHDGYVDKFVDYLENYRRPDLWVGLQKLNLRMIRAGTSQRPAAVVSSTTTSNAESSSSTSKLEEELKVASRLRIFTFNDLKLATQNFRPESLLGEGGFGCVFKGWIEENGTAPVKPGTGLTVAVKTLNHDGLQGS